MIENYSAGRMQINGNTYHNDLKIVGGEVRPDWWRPGGHIIDEEDIRDILEEKPEVLVIGTGYAENARLSEKALSRINELGIQLRLEATPRAVKTFNHLLDSGKAVSGAFHLTC